MTEKSTQVSRRAVIAGVGTAGVAGMLPIAAPAAEAVTWTHSADIVCVGSGAAALSAAITALGNGDSVIVVEKMPILGGTTTKSGGVAWIPNNFLLREKGIADPKAECMRYMARFSDPERYQPNSPTLGLGADSYALIEAFYDNAAPAVDRLRALGAYRACAFTVASWLANPEVAQLVQSSPDYFDHDPDNKVSSGRMLGAQREDGGAGTGSELIAQFEDFLTGKNVPILRSHKVERLILDKGGRVIGVAATHEGKTVTVKAKKAVIFGTGGYAHNPEFVRLYQQCNIYGSCASSASQGDFIRIGGQVGAKLGHLGGAWRTQVVVEEALLGKPLAVCAFVLPGDSKLLVNKYGRRVVNEARDYNDRTRVHFTYNPTQEEFPNHFLFMVFDQRTLDLFGGDYPLPAKGTPSPYVISGDTLAALSANIGARLTQIAAKSGNLALAPDFSDALAKTVDQFNLIAKSGKDPDFHRGDQAYDREWFYLFSTPTDFANWQKDHLPNHTMYPLSANGPYHAIILAAGALDTNGGPVINAKGQVVGYDGRPIAGLYGAGNCIASPTRDGYYGGGGTIGPALTFGYIAATNAHNETVHA